MLRVSPLIIGLSSFLSQRTGIDFYSFCDEHVCKASSCVERFQLCKVTWCCTTLSFLIFYIQFQKFFQVVDTFANCILIFCVIFSMTKDFLSFLLRSSFQILSGLSCLKASPLPDLAMLQRLHTLTSIQSRHSSRAIYLISRSLSVPPPSPPPKNCSSLHSMVVEALEQSADREHKTLGNIFTKGWMKLGGWQRKCFGI